MIKAWTKVRADSWDRYFRIRRILYKWKNPDLQVLWICSWRFRLESNHDPKFLTTVTGTTSILPTVRLISRLKIFHCNKDNSFLCLGFFNQIRASATLDNTELSVNVNDVVLRWPEPIYMRVQWLCFWIEFFGRKDLTDFYIWFLASVIKNSRTLRHC